MGDLGLALSEHSFVWFYVFCRWDIADSCSKFPELVLTARCLVEMVPAAGLKCGMIFRYKFYVIFQILYSRHKTGDIWNAHFCKMSNHNFSLKSNFQTDFLQLYTCIWHYLLFTITLDFKLKKEKKQTQMKHVGMPWIVNQFLCPCHCYIVAEARKYFSVIQVSWFHVTQFCLGIIN